MAGLPVLLILIFVMRFDHTSCSSKWLSSPHNYRICLFMIKWQITNWKHLFSNFLWIHIYVLSLWPWHETYCTTSGSHIYENISCCIPQKNVSGADPYLFVKASFCENRLCLLLNQNCFSLSMETLKDIINLI